METIMKTTVNPLCWWLKTGARNLARSDDQEDLKCCISAEMDGRMMKKVGILAVNMREKMGIRKTLKLRQAIKMVETCESEYKLVTLQRN
jgi:hypothetical protein